MVEEVSHLAPLGGCRDPGVAVGVVVAVAMAVTVAVVLAVAGAFAVPATTLRE